MKLLQLVRTDLDRERKSRIGLKGLSQSFNSQENQNFTDKLYHIRSMLTYLEGARFKLQSALLELDHKPRGAHPLAPHIQITRDRTGLQQSILKVPIWLKNADEEKPNSDSDALNDSNEEDVASTADVKNDVLIKNFDRNFSRSKSSVEYPVAITTGAGTASTIIVDSHNSESIDFDRGIADGGSNQHDSDFGKFYEKKLKNNLHFHETYFVFFHLIQMNSLHKMKTTKSVVETQYKEMGGLHQIRRRQK